MVVVWFVLDFFCSKNMNYELMKCIRIYLYCVNKPTDICVFVWRNSIHFSRR